MKGHKRSRCTRQQTLTLEDGSSYDGTTYDDVPSGTGVLTMPNGDTYTGDFENGLRHGVGTLCTDTHTYKGTWHGNKFHGLGTLHYATGEMYDGEFSNGLRHGIGRLVESTRAWYRGEWRHDRKHGRGSWHSDEGMYEGQFQNGRRHGSGTMTYTNGSTYKGHWSRGVRCGKGHLKGASTEYMGYWREDEYHGYGTLQCVSTGTYEGHWKNGRRHKKGRQTSPKGDVYDGGWSRGRRQGAGTWTLANGDVFEGFWIGGLRNGWGRFVTKSFTHEGEWRDDMREGSGSETRDGLTYTGHWSKDKRHGVFTNADHPSQLWVWGEHFEMRSNKQVKRTIVRLLERSEYERALDAAQMHADVLKWSWLIKHDKHGHLVQSMDVSDILTFIKSKAWSLFKKKRYAFISACVTALPSDALTVVQDTPGARVLFDNITQEFTADPWIVGQASYSAQTRARLLEGLHLGEFGRCEPMDPFTRKRLTPASGTFLHDMPKRARKVWKSFVQHLGKTAPVVSLAYQFNVADYEELLRNARLANDMHTVRSVMKDRDDYISRERASSLCGIQSPPS